MRLADTTELGAGYQYRQFLSMELRHRALLIGIIGAAG